MSKGKVLLGVLVGTAIGATLGVLFAPDKGSATRKKITAKRNEFSNSVEEKFNHLIDSATDRFRTTGSKADRQASKNRVEAES